MSTRKWYALGIVLAAIVAGTLMRVLLGRSLLVDLTTAAGVIAAIIVAVIVSREHAR
ncbi:MAG TPA: hypothetical protein VJN63_12375 [Thermoplasmata archaeon]|nr:hypothetical protein [Thermoplasmata archaeon]